MEAGSGTSHWRSHATWPTRCCFGQLDFNPNGSRWTFCLRGRYHFACATSSRGGLPVTFRSSSDDKERIRQAIDIVDLVGSYTSLRRQGRNYVALCPWHDDSRPSLQVNPERQSFKCWVCNIGGDVFSFLMKMENVEFGEAVAMLAERAGIQLTPYDPRRGGSPVPGDVAGEPPSASARDPDVKRVLYQAAAWAEQLFHECLLRDPEAEPARQYLRDRGISDESIRHFHLGYSPDSWDWLIKQSLRTKKFSHGVLERIGLLGRKQVGGGHYDRFKGRVLFSIRDVQGRPVGIGGRVLPGQAATNPAKYVNSPESPLFSKSNLLYGLDLARNAITKTRTAVVTEGYTDCIIARQAGFENVLAVLGTALGERHIKLLKRFADRVVLVLDGDEAGQKRHRRNPLALPGRASRFTCRDVARRAGPLRFSAAAWRRRNSPAISIARSMPWNTPSGWRPAVWTFKPSRTRPRWPWANCCR